MHIAPYDNQNQAIIAAGHPKVPLVYFNIVKLTRGESFTSHVPGYETCLVPATGTIDVQTGADSFATIGTRRLNVWDGPPEGVYISSGMAATMTCQSDHAEIFIAGALFDQVLPAFAVRACDIDPVQYGSDDTKTHRKIKHILGTKYHGRVGRLLVSELYTVGAGGWSGFPSHKHDTNRLPDETRHDEAYNFRFNPPHGSGLQMLQREDGKSGDAYHIVDGSTVAIDKGYHPCCVLPGYEMYYFTILAGETQRSLVQYFQPSHADQIETIPGIKDMIAKFK
ncbi:5-deoxy-glucuronate isomerase [Cypionkella sp.]|jgi:5-deoxy-glucuronate isomerase|uniref:5-deoxy-glucuronate isomerase n=1 Tax=Cypionkella sp. TaxID=2811411 RepID=UPI00271E86F6|nr:5-deoxy-glucuronate isomerase [Cypionkella sp.]MDO8985818.1 5-deoxy-glucuronate isomerase [Cypionkella sp.]MDP2051398.1 5-deoxy-glucuronate isomerase [Cypionkella sp.]